MDGIKRKLYKVWHSMNSRCSNTNNSDYKSYGAKGVYVCQEWEDSFDNFHDWAMVNGYKEGLQLDKDFKCLQQKIKPAVYSPSTCQFITGVENSKIKSLDMTKTTNKNIAILFDVHYDTVGRYEKGSAGKKRLFKAMRDYFEKMEQSGELSKIKGFEK